MNTIVKFIGAVIIPFIASWGILLAGKFIIVMGQVTTTEDSDFPMTPLKAVIILFIFDSLAGAIIPVTAYSIAPKFKRFFTSMVVLLAIIMVSILVFAFPKCVWDCVAGGVGMLTYGIALCRSKSNKQNKRVANKVTRYRQPDAYF